MRLHVGQKSGCFTLEWQTEWSWLKLMRSPRAAEKRRTGIEIRPKVTWPFQTVEAMMLLARNLKLSRNYKVSQQAALEARKLAAKVLKCEAIRTSGYQNYLLRLGCNE